MGGWELLERGDEQAQLDRIVADAGRGIGRLALISGEAGIGKTALLEHARGLGGESGLNVLFARGGELERDFGFGVVRQLLLPPLSTAEPEHKRQLTGGAAAIAERVLTPSESGESPAAQDAALHGLYWLVANLAADGPLMLAVDDAHWADRPSLRFLDYLARRLEGLACAMVVSVRSGEDGSDPDLLRALEVEAPTMIRPAPLSEGAVSQLVAARLGESTAELASACTRVTSGNPFMLSALLEELSRDGRAARDLDPDSISRFASRRVTTAMLLRIGRLGSEAMKLAEAIAVLGEHAHAAQASELAGLSQDEAGAAADALIRAAILEDAQPLRFIHPIVRTAIYEDVPPAARSALHHRAATVLEEAGADTETVALHLLATEPAEDASTVERLRQAAALAGARGSPETASRYLRRAMREKPPDGDRAGLALELARSAWWAGEADFIDLMRRAVELADDATTRARAVAYLAPGLVFAGHVGEALEALEQAMAQTEDEGLQRTLESQILVAGQANLATRRQIAPLMNKVRARVETDPESRAPVTLACLVHEIALGGADAEEIAELAEESLVGGHLVSMVGMPFPFMPAFFLAVSDRPVRAREVLDETLVLARARGSQFGVAFPLAYRALAHLRRGSLHEAEADALEAVDAGTGLPYSTGVAVALTVLIERGEIGEARELLAQSQDQLPPADVFSFQLVHEARARLARAEGDHQRALAELEACAAWEEQSGAPLVVPVSWRSQAALAQLALGDDEQASALAAEELEIARRFGARRQLGLALCAAGLASGGEAGLELLREAVAELERSEDRLEHARALVELGSALRRAGLRTEARATLGEGMDLAHRIGATALAERARGELRVAGARPRRLAATGRASLTPSELRVAEMAVEGKTNPEIAQALFVTLRTVEMHLSNAYRKLEISSRKELAGALSEQPTG